MEEYTYCLEEDGLPDLPDKFDSSPVTSLLDMPDTAQKEYWAVLALRHSAGLGVRTQNKLLRFFGSPWNAINNIGSWADLGINKSCIQAIAGNAWRAAAKKEWDAAKKAEIKILLWHSETYPPLLRQLKDAPLLLYCLGDLKLLRAPAIGLVGSRNATDESLRVASFLSKQISASGISIVSGMAHGIDKVAHSAALTQCGSSIGVLGTGIDCIYPYANRDLFAEMRKTGLLVSEFAPGSPPAAANFPIRNRIISGLSLGVVVVEAAERSGSLITARLALEQNREVFAVPGPPLSSHSKGCQNLVRDGAHPVFSADDILCALSRELKNYNLNFNELPANWTEESRKKKSRGGKTHCKNVNRENGANSFFDLPIIEKDRNSKATAIAAEFVDESEAAKILACLNAHGVLDIEHLMSALNMPAEVINTNLILMEMQQKIKRLPGARFEAV